MTSSEPVKYSAAMDKVEGIISAIANNEVDVDDLSEKVEEAAGLLRSCRDKLNRADEAVTKTLQSLSEPAVVDGTVAVAARAGGGRAEE